MSRPSDWSPLQRFDDPVPGNWSAVSSASARYGRVADSIDQAKTDLLSAFADDSMTGESIEAMREVALQVADRIERAWDRYRGVADALSGYVEPLRTAQSESLVLLQRASETQSERVTAENWVRHWQSEHQRRAFAGEPDVDEAFDRWQYWQGQVHQTHQDVGAAIAALNRVIEARDTAADIAAGLIEDVENTGDINDDFWDKVDQFLTENPWIDTVIEIAGYVATALAIVAMFVPGLNLIVLAVSIIVAVAVVANAWAKAGTGRLSIVEAIVTTAFAVIPFGVGKLLGNAATAARSNVANQATRSIMASAAGSGVSGITRPVAANAVAQFMARRPTPLLATSGFGELINLSALAKTPILLSGNTSAAVANLVRPAVSWTLAHEGSDFAFDAVETALDEFGAFDSQPANSWQDANW